VHVRPLAPLLHALHAILVVLELIQRSPRPALARALRCPNCGYENDPGDVVCMGCGWPIGDDPGPPEDDERFG
jgi:hypothetical protein